MTIDSTTRTVTRRAPAEHIDADICVVGGGAAGAIAALSAARLGRRTVLLDAGATLGGQLVTTLLGTICGLYSNGPNPRRVTHGPIDDMLESLWREGALAPRRALDTLVLHYDEARCGRWLEDALADAGVALVLGATLRHATLEGRRVVGLAAATRYGELEVTARGFIDASGDAALAWHAGLPVREPATPQWGTQMFVLEGCDPVATAGIDFARVESMLRRRGRSAGLPREDGFVFGFPGRDIATVNMTHIPTPLDAVSATRSSLEGRRQADRLLLLLKEEFPQALGRARVRAYGQTGIRQTRWIVARRQLAIEDVRSGIRPPDAVARCAWPVEAHDSAARIAWEMFDSPDHMHWVPLSAMAHRDADNLVAAGRCIDGDTAALASVRVMGPCFAMGEAAAHALDLAGDGSVHDIDPYALAGRLAHNLESDTIDPWCVAA